MRSGIHVFLSSWYWCRRSLISWSFTASKTKTTNKLRARQSPFVFELLITESCMKMFLKIVNSEKSNTLIRRVRDWYLLNTGIVSRVVMSSLVYAMFQEAERMRGPLCLTTPWDAWDKLFSGTCDVRRYVEEKMKMISRVVKKLWWFLSVSYVYIFFHIHWTNIYRHENLIRKKMFRRRKEGTFNMFNVWRVITSVAERQRLASYTWIWIRQHQKTCVYNVIRSHPLWPDDWGLEDTVDFQRSRWFVFTTTDTLKKILLYNRAFFFEE